MPTIDTFTNFATSTLASSIAAGDTSLSVASGAGSKYPSSAPFMLLLGTTSGAYELVKCTSRVSDTLTIVRGQEGTTASSWAAGSTPVTQVVTAANMSNLWAASPQVYNVRAYGAKGDGTTDDTTAIRAALTAAASGGTVMFPPGNYKITDYLTPPVNSKIVGSGDGATIITQTGSNKNIFQATDPYNISISSLKMVGIGTGTGKGINFALSVNTNMMLITLDQITVDDVGSDGVYLENPIVSTFNRVNTHSCGGYGINLVGVGTGVIGTSCTLTSCYADTNAGAAGFRLSHMNYTSLVSCASDSNAIGYLIDTCQGVSLSGCGAESCTTNGIKINAGFGITADACWFYDDGGVAVYVTGSAASIILQNMIENSPHAGATNFIKVDAGSFATIIGFSNTTANSFLGDVTTIQDDGGGNITTPGTLALIADAQITFGAAADTNLYRLAANSLGTDDAFTAFGALNAQNLLTLAQSSTQVSLSSSGTIATANLGVSRVTTSGAVTGVILASGTVAGQIVIVVNASANSITFAAAGTSHVADGTSSVIAANSARLFVWNSTGSLWYPCK
jgi:hypothetical protein